MSTQIFDSGTANPQMNIAVYHGRGDGTFETGPEIAPDLRRVANIAVGELYGESQSASLRQYSDTLILLSWLSSYGRRRSYGQFRKG